MVIHLPSQVKQVLKIIQESGYEAYVVGGCVRDTIIGIETHDYDIATNARPHLLLDIFKAYTLIHTGIKHGTVTVIIGGMPIEITTYRVDGPYADNRRPDSVEFALELKEDLKRRDFTMNAIAFNESHGIIDFFNGQEDIKNRMIRCVGNPEDRFEEDALRMLRGLRFSSKFGFTIEEKATQSIHDKKNLLRNISIERIASEFSKMICGEFIEKVLLEFSDIISVIIPELSSVIEQEKEQDNTHVNLSTINAVANTPMVLHLRLASLLQNIKAKPSFIDHSEVVQNKRQSIETIRKILQDMRYDNDTVQRVVMLVLHNDMEITVDSKQVKRWMNKLTPQVMKEILLLKKINEFSQNREESRLIYEIKQMDQLIEKIISDGTCYLIKHLAIKGDEILKLGVQPGKIVGETLEYLLEQVIDGNIKNGKKELSSLALEYLKTRNYINLDEV